MFNGLFGGVFEQREMYADNPIVAGEGAFVGRVLDRIRGAKKLSAVGSVGGLLSHPHHLEHFKAIHHVPIFVDPALPNEKPAHTKIWKLTDAQKKAGVPVAHIYIRPDATPEHIFHEMVHADRASKGRAISGEPWPHPEEHRALMAGRYWANKSVNYEDAEPVPFGGLFGGAFAQH